MIKKVCVAGAGTMGSGIAFTAAQYNFETILFDINAEGIERAKIAVNKNASFLLSKGKITQEEFKALQERITYSSDISSCKADIIIEAIIEDHAVKNALYLQLNEINSPETIFASNTSSLSISEIQKNIPHPERVAGMHFFNPANVMKLVEVIAGEHTSSETIDAITALCKTMNKVPVFCKDSPGFIVNRVARPYYLEAMNIVSSYGVDVKDADALLENAGFKMGPFKLMDLIGMDINLAVSKSVYEAFNKEARFKPAILQEQKVAAGELGKKTGKGFYNYENENVSL